MSFPFLSALVTPLLASGISWALFSPVFCSSAAHCRSEEPRSFANTYLRWLPSRPLLQRQEGNGAYFLFGVGPVAAAVTMLAVESRLSQRPVLNAIREWVGASLGPSAAAAVPKHLWLACVAVPSAAMLLAAALFRHVDKKEAERIVPNWPPEPGTYVAALVGQLPFLPMEELAWRALLLPRLALACGSPLAASLLTGVAWSFWHLPLFHPVYYQETAAQASSNNTNNNGGYQWELYQDDFSLEKVVSYTGFLTAVSLTMLPVYQRSGRSLWPALLFHSSMNATAAALGMRSLSHAGRFFFHAAASFSAASALWSLCQSNAGLPQPAWTTSKKESRKVKKERKKNRHNTVVPQANSPVMAERRRGEGKKGNKGRNVGAAEERRRQAVGAGTAAPTTREDMEEEEEEEAAQTIQRHHGKRAKGRKQNKFNAEDPPSAEENEQSKKKKGRNQSGKQGKNTKGGKKGGRNAGGGKKGGGGGGGSEYGFMEVSPARIRFAHSRIRPVFSGCGRRVEDTLADIREGRTRVEDLPLITVVTVNSEEKGKGKKEEEEPWFFSLNNRRLYVFKRLYEEGLLEKVRVRVRPMQEHERTRYTVERCSLQARIFGRPNQKGAAAGDSPHSDEEERKEGGGEEEEEEKGEEEEAGEKEESSDAEST
ncbi:H/ACA ribonucleoprotein complex subunit 1 [Balamuthia mandrillaris]